MSQQIVCVQCGEKNEFGSNHCSSCGAMLPKMAPKGVPGGDSLMEIGEGAEYVLPEQRYENPHLQKVAWALHYFLEEGEPLDPFLEAYDDYRDLFEEFLDGEDKFKEIYYLQKDFMEEDDFPTQANYLLGKARIFYEEGTASIESFLEGMESDDLSEEDEERLSKEAFAGVRKLLDANDHLCLVKELNLARMVAFDHFLRATVEELNEEEKERVEEFGRKHISPDFSLDTLMATKFVTEES